MLRCFQAEGSLCADFWVFAAICDASFLDREQFGIIVLIVLALSPAAKQGFDGEPVDGTANE